MQEVTTNDIRAFLLGLETDKRDLIEEKLFGEAEFLEILESEEEELIQDFVDGELSKVEVDAFENHFLISDERRRKVVFAETLRKRIDSAQSKIEEKDGNKGFWSGLKNFGLPTYGLGFAALLVAVFLGWFLIFRTADDDAAMAMKQAFEKERPLLASVSDIGYSPYISRKGVGDQNAVNQVDFDRASELIRKRASEDASARNLYALGRLYLLKKDFLAAVQQFGKAEEAGEKSAELNSDWSAALLERARRLDSQKDSDARLKLLDEALGRSEKALSINPDNENALFNKALILEETGDQKAAISAYDELISKHANSKWSEEARRRKEDLSRGLGKRFDAEATIKRLAALNGSVQRDVDWFQTLSENRELITDLYLPIRLSGKISKGEAPDDKEDFAALQNLGEIESTLNADRFGKDLADFYKTLDRSKLEIAAKAHEKLRSGYDELLADRFEAAQTEFLSARDLFRSIGDSIEADSVSTHFVGYTKYFLSQKEEALEDFESVERFCTENEYRWLYLVNRQWVIGARYKMGRQAPDRTRTELVEALKEATEIGDLYTSKKFLGTLLSDPLLVSNSSRKSSLLHSLNQLSNNDKGSERQVFRDLDIVVRTSLELGLKNIAKQVSSNSVELAKGSTDRLFRVNSLINSSNVFLRADDIDDGGELLKQAGEVLDSFPESEANLEKADLSRMKAIYSEHAGDYVDAKREYEEAVAFTKNQGGTPDINGLELSILESRMRVGRDSNWESDAETLERELVSSYAPSKDISERRTRKSLLLKLFGMRSEAALASKHLEASLSFVENQQKLDLYDMIAEDLNSRNISESASKQILVFRSFPKELVLFLVDSDGTKAFHTNKGSPELSELAGRYHEAIATGQTSEEEVTLSKELFQILLSQVVDKLRKDIPVCIVPDSTLETIPFSALSAPDGNRFAATNLYFLANDVSSCVDSTAEAGVEKDGGMLFVGNPKFDQATFPDLEPLPDDSREQTAIADAFPNTTVLRANDASKQRFVSQIRTNKFVHYSGHFIAEPTSPGFSRFVLAKSSEEDSNLTLDELDSINLPPLKLAVFSSCETGVSFSGDDGRRMSVKNTFLRTGAENVIASLWRVDSRASSRLFEIFYAELKKGRGIVKSLGIAKRTLAQSTKGEARPYEWAGFELYTGKKPTP
ncbi:MAG: CHAT domain-containing protein [Pyrinomonadaceae bacterium]